MLETIGIFAIIGLIFWGLYLLGRWSARVEQRSATKVAKKLTDKYLSGWWLRNSDRSRSSYVWQHAATGFFVVCGVWFVLGLFLGPKAFPGGIFLYLPWRRAHYTWDANMAECQLRGLAGPVAPVSVTFEASFASTAPTNPVPTISEQFYVHVREETKGPYTQAQIISMWDSGVLTADALYWSEDAQAWLPLRELIVPTTDQKLPIPPPAVPASPRWTWREWTTVSILLPLALLVWGVAYSAFPKRTTETVHAPAAVVSPSPEPAPVSTDLRTQQAAVAEQVKRKYPDLADPNSLLSRAATNVRSEWNRDQDARLSSPYMARLLMDEVLERAAAARSQEQAVPRPAPQETPPAEPPPEFYEPYATFAKALYPDLNVPDSALHRNTDALISPRTQQNSELLAREDAILIATQSVAKNLGISLSKFVDPTAPQGSTLRILSIYKPSSGFLIQSIQGLNSEGTPWVLSRDNAIY